MDDFLILQKKMLYLCIVKQKTTNNMNTNKYPISYLDELDDFELADKFVDKLPKKDQERLNYIFHEDYYSDSDYWDELRKLVYKNFGTESIN